MDFSWIGSPEFVGGVFGLSALNSVGTNIFNYGLQREAYDYQKTLNERIMEREDTAIQRRMQDAISAGVNPYAVVGQGAGAGGSVSAPSAPQMKSGGTIDALRTALDAYTTVSEVQKRKQEVATMQQELENKKKEGLILDADLAGKLDTNRIIGYNADNAFLETQRNLAGFNFDFGRSYYYDSEGKFRDLQNEIWRGAKPFTPYGNSLVDTQFYKARKAENDLKYENWLNKNYQNATYWDDWSQSYGLKKQQNEFFAKDWYFNAFQTQIMNMNKQYQTQADLYNIMQSIRTSKARQRLYEKELAWYDAEKTVDIGSDILDYLIDLLNFTNPVK